MSHELDTNKREKASVKLHHRRSPQEKIKIRNLSPNRYRSKNHYIQLRFCTCMHFINEQGYLKEKADQTLLLKKHRQ